jgi:serine protease inhibitor
MTPTRSIISATAVALLANACALDSATRPAGVAAKLESLPRPLTAVERSLIGSANSFSFALWRIVDGATGDSNVFVAPLSASFSLGMTLNGAANQTYDEMRSALQFGGADQGEINQGYKSLIGLLTSLDPTVKMNVANSIWYRSGFPIYQSFLDAGKTYFDADVRPLDFGDAPGSLATINGWVSDKTAGKIPTILDQIRTEDVMFLINAIYFKGSWRERFDPAETRDGQFFPASGPTQTAKLMRRVGSISYAETDRYQAVDLPYGNSAFSMTVVLPKGDADIRSLSAALATASWDSLTARLLPAEVNLTLPRVRLAWSRTLNDDLKSLGMRVPFMAHQADFTRMSSAGDRLAISFVKQKTFVDIDEEGTEAAAVTVTTISVTSAPLTYVMRVDRPFIFVLRERLTGTILFMGKIVRLPS